MRIESGEEADRLQMQDFMKLYSGMVERCFNACAQDFTSKALSTNEVSHDTVTSSPST